MDKLETKRKKIEVFSKYIASLSKEMEVIEYQTENSRTEKFN